jgi:hypothetical protein
MAKIFPLSGVVQSETAFAPSVLKPRDSVQFVAVLSSPGTASTIIAILGEGWENGRILGFLVCDEKGS